MDVNLYLALDDELAADVRQFAAAHGRSVEEEIRKRIIEGVGGNWEPLTADDIINDSRLNIMYDLRPK